MRRAYLTYASFCSGLLVAVCTAYVSAPVTGRAHSLTPEVTLTPGVAPASASTNPESVAPPSARSSTASEPGGFEAKGREAKRTDAPGSPKQASQNPEKSVERSVGKALESEASTPLSSNQPHTVAQIDSQPLSRSPTALRIAELRALSPIERQAILRETLHDGSPDQLDLISTDVLRRFPEYRIELLPVMKEAVLAALLRRFSDTDWLSWDFASFAVNGGPTAARAYVNLITASNPELGQYAEVAARTWSRLFTVTRAGNIFRPDSTSKLGLAQPHLTTGAKMGSANIPLGTEATSSMAVRAPTNGLPNGGTELATSMLLDDPVFVSTLERLRRRLITSYIAAHPDEPLKSLTLLLSISPGEFKDEQISLLVSLFRRFTLEGTPRYRREVSARLQSASLLTHLRGHSPELSRSIAEFLLMCSIDALNVRDVQTATAFLDESLGAQKGLRGQDLVGNLLQEMKTLANSTPTAPVETTPAVGAGEGAVPTAAVPAPPVSNERDTTDIFGRASRSNSTDQTPASGAHSAESGARTHLADYLATGLSYVFTLLIVVVLGGGVFLFVLYQRSVRSLRPVPSTTVKSADSTSTGVKMTAPNEMNFGAVDDDADFDLRRSVAA